MSYTRSCLERKYHCQIRNSLSVHFLLPIAAKVLIWILKEWMDELQSIDLNCKTMIGWTSFLNICSYGHKDVVNRLFFFSTSILIGSFLPLTFLEVTTLSWKEIDWLHKSLISLYFFVLFNLWLVFCPLIFHYALRKVGKLAKNADSSFPFLLLKDVQACCLFGNCFREKDGKRRKAELHFHLFAQSFIIS